MRVPTAVAASTLAPDVSRTSFSSVEAGTIVFPGYDGGAEWGGPAFDPESNLLYVNTIEMAWLLKMIPRDDKSLYKNNCASCHREDLTGTPGQIPTLVGIGAPSASTAQCTHNSSTL